ncbi:hypothetical protein SANTM175S_05533 [Streptomyces antimycoticus]
MTEHQLNDPQAGSTAPSDGPLSGCAALVTGVSSGIGAATALALAQGSHRPGGLLLVPIGLQDPRRHPPQGGPLLRRSSPPICGVRRRPVSASRTRRSSADGSMCW